MPSLDDKLPDWTRQRRRLELETRVLVVEDERPIRQQLDDLLYRHRISSRSVELSDQAVELLAGGSYPLLLVSENLAGLGGLYLLRQVRRQHPEIDALVSSWEPNLDLLGHAFELRLTDVIRKPLPDRQSFGEQMHHAIRRNVDRRMRRSLVGELRQQLEELPEELRLPTTQGLEARLNAFKRSLGNFNRVLIVEGDDPDLRAFGENLLLSGLHIESTPSLEHALVRAGAGEVHMVVLQSSADQVGVREIITGLRQANPIAEVLLVSSSPDAAAARTALAMEAAGYVIWPPTSLMVLVDQVQRVLRHSRRERLLDNLVVELFRETNRALGGQEESFGKFCKLLGLDRIGPDRLGDLVRANTGEAVEYLDDVLDSLLGPEGGDAVVISEEEAAAVSSAGAERRVHPRVLESQFVRFRPKAALANTLALVGDLSEGGIFIRTGELLAPGTILELEFHAVLREQAYLVCCRAQVAWVARDNRQSPLGPGFGVRFIDAPEDVITLLKEIVDSHIRAASDVEPG